MTTHAEVAESPEVRRAIPALADLAGRIGDPQVRNRGTMAVRSRTAILPPTIPRQY